MGLFFEPDVTYSTTSYGDSEYPVCVESIVSPRRARNAAHDSAQEICSKRDAAR